MNIFIESIVNYLALWKLTINFDKCETILFRKSEKLITRSQKRFKINENVVVNINNHLVVAKDTIQYLGVIFHKKCGFIPHIDKSLKKASGAYALLSGVFKRKSLSIRTKEICYKQLIGPILQYGFSAWCSISSHQMARIRSFERKILYKCLPASIAYNNENIDNCYRLIPKIDLYKKFKNFKRIDSVLYSSFLKFVNKLEYSDIHRLKSICDSEYLSERYSSFNDRFHFKCFAPSLLFKLYLDDKTTGYNNIFTFFNRRYNSNILDEYVYDLAVPD